jgi:hypothetical protein
MHSDAGSVRRAGGRLPAGVQYLRHVGHRQTISQVPRQYLLGPLTGPDSRGCDSGK